MFFQRIRECRGCGELREELAKASRKLEELRLDWETVQDKVHRWMQRTSARARQEERELPAPPSDNGVAAATVDPVSAKILARRGRHASIANGDG